MNTASSKRWFHNRPLLIILLFLFPPFGIYGMFRRDTQTWKKILYTLFGLLMSIIILGNILILAFPVNHYENGHALFQKGDLKEASNELKKVGGDEVTYSKAQNLLKEIRYKLDSIKACIEREKAKQILVFTDFQKRWADSIVKSESQPGNRHLVGSVLKLPDTILFEYTKSVTEKGFDVNLKNDSILYRNAFKKSLRSNLRGKIDSIKVFISCIPNRNVDFGKIVAENKAKAARAEKIMQQFSPWDGSHIALKSYIKENLKDPSSFEHLESTYTDKGGYIIVLMRFRARNSYGALDLRSVKAKIDISGNILSAEEISKY